MIRGENENPTNSVITLFNSDKYPKAIKFQPATKEEKLESCITCRKPGYRYYANHRRGGTLVYYMHYNEPPMGVRENNNRLYFLYRRCTSRNANIPLIAT
jgi:hypothetical protein